MAAARVWTKDFNMRLKKSLEKYWTHSDQYTLQVLRMKPEFIPEYCKNSAGIHLINQTSMSSKIKTDVMKELKLKLKEREQVFLEQ